MIFVGFRSSQCTYGKTGRPTNKKKKISLKNLFFSTVSENKLNFSKVTNEYVIIREKAFHGIRKPEWSINAQNSPRKMLSLGARRVLRIIAPAHSV